MRNVPDSGERDMVSQGFSGRYTVDSNGKGTLSGFLDDDATAMFVITSVADSSTGVPIAQHVSVVHDNLSAEGQNLITATLTRRSAALGDTLGNGVVLPILCDDGDQFGHQYAGTMVLTGQGDANLSLSGICPNTPFRCSFECGLQGMSISLPECAASDSNGDLQVLLRGVGEGVGGVCSGLSVGVDAADDSSTSCIAGFAAGACRRKRQVNNGVVTISCRRAGCTGNCNVVRFGNNHPDEGTDTGVSDAVCDDGETCTCQCR